jgi:hypothetical protein
MKKVIIATLAFAPSVAFAQELGNITNLLESVGNLVDLALPIVIAIALLVFFWGLVKFIFAGAEAKDEGKTLMIWGVVALFVMVSVWGLVRFIGNAFDIEQGGTVPVPGVEGL